MADPKPPEPRPRGPRARDVVLAALFTLGWLVPISVAGFLGDTPRAWPMKARDFYSVSCLFGSQSERVSVFYVQVRREGARGWSDVDEALYFGLEPFGHRTRFDRFMARFGYQDSPSAARARAELGGWLAAREGARTPEAGAVVAVRYLWVNRELEGEPQGCWQKPARRELPRQTVQRRLGGVVLIPKEAR